MQQIPVEDYMLFSFSFNLPIAIPMEDSENKISQHQDFYRYCFYAC